MDEDEDLIEHLSDEDSVKLNQAKHLIQSTDFWKNHASEDYDYHLYMANHGINETLNGNWWT